MERIEQQQVERRIRQRDKWPMMALSLPPDSLPLWWHIVQRQAGLVYIRHADRMLYLRWNPEYWTRQREVRKLVMDRYRYRFGNYRPGWLLVRAGELNQNHVRALLMLLQGVSQANRVTQWMTVRQFLCDLAYANSDRENPQDKAGRLTLTVQGRAVINAWSAQQAFLKRGIDGA